MLSLDLREILPTKMLFFVRQKVQISSKIWQQIPNFANCVKFHHKSIFSSRRPVSGILSVFFVKKRNPLEPSNCSVGSSVVKWQGMLQSVLLVMHGDLYHMLPGIYIEFCFRGCSFPCCPLPLSKYYFPCPGMASSGTANLSCPSDRLSRVGFRVENKKA